MCSCVSSIFNWEKSCKKPAGILKSLRVLELLAGFEPATCWLRISCSTDWATAAYTMKIEVCPLLFLLPYRQPAPHHYEWCALPLSHASTLNSIYLFSFLLSSPYQPVSDRLITSEMLYRLSHTSILRKRHITVFYVYYFIGNQQICILQVRCFTY